MKVNVVKTKLFAADKLEPLGSPDGTSLEEKVNAWLRDAGEKTLIGVTVDGVSYTATVLFTD
jgi:hypothetical protein